MRHCTSLSPAPQRIWTISFFPRGHSDLSVRIEDLGKNAFLNVVKRSDQIGDWLQGVT